MVKIHIIGAGLAGLAAAVETIKAGMRPVLYEMTDHAGGRCRSYYDESLQTEIDNGNHLILGCNKSALEYIARIGSADKFLSPKEPRYQFVDIKTGNKFSYRFPGFVPGTSLVDILRLLRLFCSGDGRRVMEYFPPHSRLFRRCIEPLTLAALNTHPAEASAVMLKRLLLRLLPGSKQNSRYYLSTVPLSGALIEPALRHIEMSGGEIHYHKHLKALENNELRVTNMKFSSGIVRTRRGESIILALPPHIIKRILPDVTAPRSFSHTINAHFLWQSEVAHFAPPSFVGVINSPVQWIFIKDGVISTTTSAANYVPELKGTKHAEIIRHIWRDVCKALGFAADTHLPPHRLLIEKRATFAATPENLHLRAETTATAYPNLFIAGDWCNTGLPATIESAIKSGVTAAQEARLASAEFLNS